MCCFSGAVESVNDTNIFARSVEKGRQLLVYSMNFSAKADLAMILPLPVPAGSPDDALRFIDLKGYPEFFTDMKRGFPEPILRRPAKGSEGEVAAIVAKPVLEVVSVGSFEASFVPTLKDFARLDARFRLPDQAWDALPAYKAYGFAVFKLKREGGSPHPMAFEFPRADPKRLFFPTVHIHDGEVHPKAAFDHTLYCQKREGERTSLPDWRESDTHANHFVAIEKTQGIVHSESHCYQKKVRGERRNEDILV